MPQHSFIILLVRGPIVHLLFALIPYLFVQSCSTQRDSKNENERDAALCNERLADIQARMLEIYASEQRNELFQEFFLLFAQERELKLQLIELTSQRPVVAAAVPSFPFPQHAPVAVVPVNRSASSTVSSMTDPLGIQRVMEQLDLAACVQQAEDQDVADASKKTD